MTPATLPNPVFDQILDDCKAHELTEKDHASVVTHVRMQ